MCTVLRSNSSMGVVMFVHPTCTLMSVSMCFNRVQSLSVNVEELSEM